MERRLAKLLPVLQEGAESLEAAEELLSALMRHTPVGIFLSDAAGRCRFVNGAWSALTGLRLEQALGSGWGDALHPDDRERVAAEWQAAASVERESVISYRFLRADGSVVFVEGHASPFRDVAGELVGWVGSCLDVTRHRLAELALEREREFFGAAFEAAPIGIAVLDREGHWLRANAALCRMLGYSEEELLGLSVPDVSFPGDFGADFEQARHAADSEGVLKIEKRYLRKTGEVVWASLSVATVRDEQGQVERFIAHIEDIGERKRFEGNLRQLAERDDLTSLLNRRSFQRELERKLQEDVTNEHALLLIDLDAFKEINDTLGHACGDTLLCAVASRLEDSLRPEDLLARLGGDEFAVVISTDGRRVAAAAAATAARIKQGLKRSFLVNGLPLRADASIGVALSSRDGRTAELLLQRADIALYQAKRSGAGQSNYDPARDRHDSTRLQLLGELQRALDEGELVPFYQPKLNLKTGAIDGVEALVRWQHPTRGLFAPGSFIEAAEQTTLIGPLTLQLITNVLTQQQEWLQQGLDLEIAVNLSNRNLADPNLPQQVARLLAAAPHKPRLLLEITESALTHDPQRACQHLQELQALGVRIAVDDFGSGYTSLSFLSQYPLDQLKIDRGFISGLEEDKPRQAIVRATIALAHDLDLEAVAEGVESPHAEQLLKQLGCDLVQGYHYTRPLPADSLSAWIHGRSRITAVA